MSSRRRNGVASDRPAVLFNTPEYALFFTIVLALYFVLPFRAQNVWLLAASYFFYGSWDWRFLSLLLLSTVIDYTAGLLIQAARERGDHPAMKRARSFLSVGGQLLILELLERRRPQRSGEAAFIPAGFDRAGDDLVVGSRSWRRDDFAESDALKDDPGTGQADRVRTGSR